MADFEDSVAGAQALAKVRLFAALTPVDRAKLAGVLEDQWIDAGSVVFEAGGTGDALYILREGTAERRVAGTAIGLIHPPEIFGELALLTDAPRSASIVAVTPIRVWVLPRRRFDALLRAEPELMLHLSSAIGLELANARRALGEVLARLEAQGIDPFVPIAGAHVPVHEPAVTSGDASSEATPELAPPRRRFSVKKLGSVALALTPFLFWGMAPPEGLSVAGWHALLALVSAAVLFAFDTLPDAVVALALLAVWVLSGTATPETVLSGFATQAWVLVLAVLAIGVAVGNVGSSRVDLQACKLEYSIVSPK